METNAVLTETEIEKALQGTDWQYVNGALERELSLATVPAAVAHVVQAMFFAESIDHHPDVALTWRNVTYRLSTHSAGGVTQLDVDLARLIDAV